MSKDKNGSGAESEPESAPAPNVTFSSDQLLELVRELSASRSGNLSAEDITKLAAAAAATQSAPWWDERKFPDISVFNPLGEKDHPRPDLDGDVYWIGVPLLKADLTREEIELLNLLQPGEYHGGKWIVKNLNPGGNARKLLVLFPCNSVDERMALPNDWTNKKTGMQLMLEEMVIGPLAPA